MRSRFKNVLVVLLFGAVSVVQAQVSQKAKSIKMEIGQIEVLNFQSIGRVAVGNSKLLNATTSDDKELVLFGLSEGFTTLQVWDKNGTSNSYRVLIESANQNKMLQDIQKILRKIPNVRTSIIADKVIVEGDKLSDFDRQKVVQLTKHYPQIIDMSSQVGWDEMLMIDVQIVELPRQFVQQLGLKWGTSAEGGVQLGLTFEGSSGTKASAYRSNLLASSLSNANAIVNPALFGGINAFLNASINAMAVEGQAVVLAQPQLTARNGTTAEFLAGGEVPYTMIDDKGQTQTVFKPYGVSLNITPIIQRDGTIRSKINVEVSAVDTSMNLNGGPALKTRRTSTEFNSKSGEPIVITGFISRDQMQSMSKLPGISETPILGELFKSRNFQNNETELVIIVRSYVVKPNDKTMQRRVHRTKTILDSSFEQKPILNIPIEADAERHFKPNTKKIKYIKMQSKTHYLPPVARIPLTRPFPDRYIEGPKATKMKFPKKTKRVSRRKLRGRRR
ncbi:type II and III secretion system protein family protein [Taylorella asinigenitalis]|uniref:Type II/IV secretion system secretin RcpA/CpaC n=1 Tax=Taylorella asinigenitalis (strain MCE3) TaxID=1008459 RepID=G4QB10_TAYAM|nr:pilus assembly protein N-terminal domain-containing protein [Taylorella asinigenitalis]AEP36551.1 Type II/IV secretion system secretin RcpA/CpaC [Taylorella asinigenitalis MCE3]